MSSETDKTEASKQKAPDSKGPELLLDTNIPYQQLAIGKCGGWGGGAMEYKELYFTLQIVILKDVLCRVCIPKARRILYLDSL
jgi:hypothetical protein